VRVEVKTSPADRLRVARELRTRIGARLYREGIATRQDWRPEPPPSPEAPTLPEAPSPPEVPPLF